MTFVNIVMKTELFIESALGHELSDKRVEVLRLINETGSISKSANKANISYKAAWQAIDTLTNLAGVTLVTKVVGGAGGGGAQLTEAGKQLLKTADLLKKIREETLAQIKAGNKELSSTTLSQLAIRTSMRNHLPCHVKKLEYSGQTVRVFLLLPGGEEIVSRITLASSELLSLKPEQKVLALFKATAVKIQPEESQRKKRGQNILTGKVTRQSKGEQEDEIAVEISNGLQLVGFSSEEDNIRTKSNVRAIFDESAVVIALTD